MQEITCTVIGNAVTDVRSSITPNGVHVAHFRMAATSRRFDRAADRWVDGSTTWLRITCWRWLADHVVESIHKGDPVVVHGRLRVREWTDGDRSGTSVEIDATTVGHDLTRGRARFERVRRLSPGESDATVADATTVPELIPGSDSVRSREAVPGPGPVRSIEPVPDDEPVPSARSEGTAA